MFRDVGRKILLYLSLYPAISIIARFDANDATSRRSQSQQEESGGAENRKFTLVEIAVATNNFAILLSDNADTGTKVYKGKLHNGPEVAVKRVRVHSARRGAQDAFLKEHILFELRHDHIIRLLGTCADDGERMLVTQYMPNGSLYDHLHGRRSQLSSSPSPVTASWETRVHVLLGVARAIQHLHCRSVPLVIHGNVTSSNVLLDAAWAPRLSGFSASLCCASGFDSQSSVGEIVGTASCHGGYAEEQRVTGRISSANDVYSLGVVMLEVLTGLPPVVSIWDEAKHGIAHVSLASLVLPTIRSGRLVDILDRRPVPFPATWQQLQPLQLVAETAARCLCYNRDQRPAISDVVAGLEQALRLM